MTLRLGHDTTSACGSHSTLWQLQADLGPPEHKARAGRRNWQAKLNATDAPNRYDANGMSNAAAIVKDRREGNVV